ncbi:MAG: hypothetical protein VXY94_10505, partial [Planctomycetota bacterium]|nr:hypothetical protein [Planctomycetota bacterium]
GPPMMPPSDQAIPDDRTGHPQRVVAVTSTPRIPGQGVARGSGSYDESMTDAERTLREVRIGNVEERRRNLLSEANDRYWQRRFETQTYPADAWTPQQAGWMTPGGEPVASNWPWWAW